MSAGEVTKRSLTTQQLRDFENKGYLALEGVLDECDLEPVRSESLLDDIACRRSYSLTSRRPGFRRAIHAGGARMPGSPCQNGYYVPGRDGILTWRSAVLNLFYAAGRDSTAARNLANAVSAISRLQARLIRMKPVPSAPNICPSSA